VWEKKNKAPWLWIIGKLTLLLLAAESSVESGTLEGKLSLVPPSTGCEEEPLDEVLANESVFLWPLHD
jgi:hypothetical protein